MKIPLENGGTLIVMPATGPYHPGVSVTLDRSSYLSPIVKRHGLLDRASLITWLDLGSADSGTPRLVESLTATGLIDADSFTLDGSEVIVLEFKDVKVAGLICSL